MFDESKRRRAMRPEVRVSRQALAVVQPINRQIGQWQAATIRLMALGRKARLTGRPTDDLRRETLVLSALVKEHEAALQARTQELPPAVANSGRIRDTRMALGSVSRGLEATLRTLAPLDRV